jgi:Flp pilus assembly protein TadG
MKSICLNRRALRPSPARVTRGLPGSQSGIAALELAMILPLLVMMVFWIIDYGRMIQARTIVANVSREGGSLASRGIGSGTTLLSMLQASGTPLNLSTYGKIYITRIAAGISAGSPNPFIDTAQRWSTGSLAVASAVGSSLPRLGLSQTLYGHLTYRGTPQNTSDIAEIWVVEVYYLYRPVTPLARFVGNLLITPGYAGKLVSSKSIF